MGRYYRYDSPLRHDCLRDEPVFADGCHCEKSVRDNQFHGYDW